jgi:cytolysin (calcineurin-like family phosphatase)
MDIIVSDRKLKQSIKILKANTLLKNKYSVSESEFDVLSYVYSDGINNIGEVKKIIESYHKNFNNEFKNLKSEYEQLRNSFQFNVSSEKALNLKLDLSRLINKAIDLLKFADSKTQQNKINTFVKEVDAYSKEIIQKLLEI